MGSIHASPEFSCLGYCRFEDCPVTVTVTVDSEEDLKAIVNYRGEKSIHNLTELNQYLYTSFMHYYYYMTFVQITHLHARSFCLPLVTFIYNTSL